MHIDKIIAQAVVKSLHELYGISATEEAAMPQATRKGFEGNLTVVVFPWVKEAHKSPEALATELGDRLVAEEAAVAGYNVVKGFLNIVVQPTYWNGVLAAIEDNVDYGITKATATSPLVMVEYSSPNTNKPLHLGHLRNILLGSSLARILSACGNRVIKTNIVNDRGIHICKSMLAWQKWFDGRTPESTGIKGDHLVGDCYVAFSNGLKKEVEELMATNPGMDKEAAEAASPLMQQAREMLRKWEAGDPEVRALWEKMNSWVYAGFEESYKRMGVDFDKTYYESQTYLDGKKKVLEGLEKGLLYRKEDGSVWADLTAEGLDQKLLLRSDGTSVYMTQDIGTAKQRFDDYPIDKMIYVVGNEQDYHFRVLSILLDRLGFKWGKDLVHFSYGMVELPEGKMKSREGTVVDADDLMEEMKRTAKEVAHTAGKLDKLGLSEAETDEIAEIVGMGALKYFLLKVDPRKNMVFNPAESIDFNGNTGSFIQYTYARIRSVLRRAKETSLSRPSYTQVVPNETEISLIQQLSDFPDVISEAGRTYSPALVANYAYELVKTYNRFYHDYNILNEPDEACRSLRLSLSDAVARIVAEAMWLLGIKVPERM